MLFRNGITWFLIEIMISYSKVQIVPFSFFILAFYDIINIVYCCL